MNQSTIELVIGALTLLVLSVSVLFIYLQLRQIKKSVRGSTYQGMIDQVSAINKIFADNPELAELWGSVKYVGVKGKPSEIRKAWVITMMMDFYENMYFQYEQGNIPKMIWERWARHIKNVFKKTEVQEQWNKAKDVYYEPFRKFIDSALYDEI